MVNTLISWVLVGIFAWAWFYVGGDIPFLTGEGGEMRDSYWFFTILAAAMLAGK
ncbi:MAG: hypothetical protein V3R20_03715 [Sphingomonadales bacterium]